MVRGGDKREAILQAALARFARYGFRRTSMEDIAREADISRAAVYLHFKNKEEIFRALARQLHEQALAAAADAAQAPGPIETRLRRILEAKVASMFDVVHGSPHAAELLDENNRICGDISAESTRRYLQLLTSVVAAAVRRQELAPRRAGLSPAGAAEMIVQCAEGIKTMGAAALTPDVYRRRLDQFVRVVVAGLGGGGVYSAAPRTGRNYRSAKEERA
jgi:AcrR family transcriptional regulator